jgi:hypothetical protein
VVTFFTIANLWCICWARWVLESCQHTLVFVIYVSIILPPTPSGQVFSPQPCPCYLLPVNAPPPRPSRHFITCDLIILTIFREAQETYISSKTKPGQLSFLRFWIQIFFSATSSKHPQPRFFPHCKRSSYGVLLYFNFSDWFVIFLCRYIQKRWHAPGIGLDVIRHSLTLKLTFRYTEMPDFIRTQTSMEIETMSVYV